MKPRIVEIYEGQDGVGKTTALTARRSELEELYGYRVETLHYGLPLPKDWRPFYWHATLETLAAGFSAVLLDRSFISHWVYETQPMFTGADYVNLARDFNALGAKVVWFRRPRRDIQITLEERGEHDQVERIEELDLRYEQAMTSIHPHIHVEQRQIRGAL